ncbi:hypothetical protein EXE48_11430 [Halorubrum sp. ASP1]|uniref:hypothetical protein n=1 Tax=Halorubrum sp. ASP1 TaxID=2518114 RepID=UPI0010F9255F|nr:hypothetical protein [Halorubrum sp. ASP1]TKX60577.1 hypothetical protein EXE48_11430 [Halorubrum sp. ASP1]
MAHDPPSTGKSTAGQVALTPATVSPEGTGLPDGKAVAKHEATVIATTGTALSRESTPELHLQLQTEAGTVNIPISCRISVHGLLRLQAELPIGDWPKEYVSMLGTVSDRAVATNNPMSIEFDSAVRFDEAVASSAIKRIYFDGALSMAAEEAFRGVEDRMNASQDTASTHMIPNPVLETTDIVGATPHSTVVAFPGTEMSDYHRLWVLAAAASGSDPFARIPDGGLPALISVPPQLEHLAGDQIRFRELVDAHHMLVPETIRKHAVNARDERGDNVFDTPPAVPSQSDVGRMSTDPSQPSITELDSPELPEELAPSLPPDSHPRARDDAAAVSSEIVDAIEDNATIPTDQNGNEIRATGWDTIPVHDAPTGFDAFELLAFTRWWFTPYGSPTPDDIEMSGADPDGRSPYLFRATAAVVYCGSAIFECELETTPDDPISTDIHQKGYLPQSVSRALRDFIKSHAPIPATAPKEKQDDPYRTAPVAGAQN